VLPSGGTSHSTTLFNGVVQALVHTIDKCPSALALVLYSIDRYLAKGRHHDHGMDYQGQPNAEHNRGNAGQSVAWCAEQKINPATATEDDIATYRKVLVAEYTTGTVAVKLAAILALTKPPYGAGCTTTTLLLGCEHRRTGPNVRLN
jgi:hypothetical protein